jgi:predicted enzyme related to lactoylglutathione lyase
MYCWCGPGRARDGQRFSLTWGCSREPQHPDDLQVGDLQRAAGWSPDIVKLFEARPRASRRPHGTLTVMADDMRATAVVRFGLVLDCRDPSSLAPFWAQALGYVELGSVDNYVLLAPDGHAGPNLLLQRVPEAKSAKNRMHLDIHTPHIEEEAARLKQLGARRVQAEPIGEHGSHWILMADPEGNEFCVCDGGGGGC